MQVITGLLFLSQLVSAIPFNSSLEQFIFARDVPQDDHIVTGTVSNKKVTNSNTDDLTTCPNWGGAVIESPPAGKAFGQVHGWFNIPTVSMPDGQSGEHGALNFVALMDDSAAGPILQAGCTFTAGKDGGPFYGCWWQWFPNQGYTAFDNFPVQAGDTIGVAMVMNTWTSGTATLTNIRTGQVATKVVDAGAKGGELKGNKAAWIFEDYTVYADGTSRRVPLPNYSPAVTFSGCSAVAGDETLGLDKATKWLMQDGDWEPLTTNIDGSNVVVAMK